MKQFTKAQVGTILESLYNDEKTLSIIVRNDSKYHIEQNASYVSSFDTNARMANHERLMVCRNSIKYYEGLLETIAE